MKKWQSDINELNRTIFSGNGEINVADETASIFAALIANNINACTLLVLPNSMQAERMINQLRVFIDLAMLDLNVLFCPESDMYRAEGGILSENSAQRCRVLEALLENRRCIVVASLGAVLSSAISPAEFRNKCIYLESGMKSIEPQNLANSLLQLDYDNEVEVHVPGEFSLRGGIVDLFSPLYSHPVRIDFWGDEIESIRFFSSSTQRSVETVKSIVVTPCSELSENVNNDLLNYLKFGGGQGVILFPDECKNHTLAFFEEKKLRFEQLLSYCNFKFIDGNKESIVYSLRHMLEFSGSKMESIVHEQLFENQLKQWNKRYRIYGAFREERNKCYFNHCVQRLGIVDCELLDSPAHHGFIVPSLNFVVLSDKEVHLNHEQVSENLVAQVRDYDSDWTIRDDVGLNSGDYVVHVNYGIAEFHGVTQVEQLGEVREVLELGFADDVIIYVPMNQAHLISRYIGQGGSTPKLSKVGTNRWKNKMHDAEEAVRDFAAELLRLQAVRASVKGFQCSDDDHMQQEFESTFPYDATEDQQKAFIDVKSDMQSPQPMDRLLCGDVGYGKTEVAIRAAFRAVMNGY
ncbi:MAG: CarD family transcriptional regulator, partial [Lentisphaeria bacterium]